MLNKSNNHSGGWAHRSGFDSAWQVSDAGCQGAQHALSGCPYPICDSTNDYWLQVGDTLRSPIELANGTSLWGVDVSADGMIQALGWSQSTRIFQIENGTWSQRGGSQLPGCVSPGAIALSPQGNKIAIARIGNQQTNSWQVDIYAFDGQEYNLEGSLRFLV